MSDKPPLRIRIKHNLWPVVGDATLMGLYAEAQYADHQGAKEFDPKTVVFEIEQQRTGRNDRSRVHAAMHHQGCA